jgi:alpha-methylacyl-CoA racemase
MKTPAGAELLPLQALRVLEFEGIGPGPMAGMMLADLGAQVTVVKRPMRPGVSAALPDAMPVHMGLDRGKNAVMLDLKTAEGQAQALALTGTHDALIEGLRPGGMEKLGLGPLVCHGVNPRLVYARMTGWGQTGPLAHAAGHDLNYVALTGLLSTMQRSADDCPTLPPTLVGDAAGALGLAFGVVSAVLHARLTGQGCVVDAAMTDITAMLGSLIHLTHASGALGRDPQAPLANSVFHGSPFYDSYRCADGRYITLCALEPQFYAQLLQRLGLCDVDAAAQYDSQHWPALKLRIQAVVAAKSMQQWQSELEGTDVCFAPVLSLTEAALHPHNVARQTYEVQAGAHGRVKAMAARGAPRFTAQPASNLTAQSGPNR